MLVGSRQTPVREQQKRGAKTEREEGTAEKAQLEKRGTKTEREEGTAGKAQLEKYLLCEHKDPVCAASVEKPGTRVKTQDEELLKDISTNLRFHTQSAHRRQECGGGDAAISGWLFLWSASDSATN